MRMKVIPPYKENTYDEYTIWSTSSLSYLPLLLPQPKSPSAKSAQAQTETETPPKQRPRGFSLTKPISAVTCFGEAPPDIQKTKPPAALALPRPAMDDCLKLLRSNNDEQRFVGLFLATKIVEGDDPEAVRRVFDAVGFPFLNRLLRTGTRPLSFLPSFLPAFLPLPLALGLGLFGASIGLWKAF